MVDHFTKQIGKKLLIEAFTSVDTYICFFKVFMETLRSEEELIRGI